jgi:hypothetical protein
VLLVKGNLSLAVWGVSFGFESRSRHGCVFLYLCVVSCVRRVLATGRLPVQGVLPHVEMDSKIRQKNSPERPMLRVGYGASVVPRREYVWGIGGIAPFILKIGTRWRWVVIFTPWRLYSRGKTLSHWTGGWVAHRAGLDVAGKRSVSTPNGNRTPIIQPVALSLYWLRYPCSEDSFSDTASSLDCTESNFLCSSGDDVSVSKCRTISR